MPPTWSWTLSEFFLPGYKSCLAGANETVGAHFNPFARIFDVHLYKVLQQETGWNSNNREGFAPGNQV